MAKTLDFRSLLWTKAEVKYIKNNSCTATFLTVLVLAAAYLARGEDRGKVAAATAAVAAASLHLFFGVGASELKM